MISLIEFGIRNWSNRLSNTITMHYREFQFSWPLIVMLIPIQAFLFVVYWYQWGDNPMPFSVLIIISLLFAVAFLIFYGMKTEVNSSHIIVAFGIGIVKKKIKLVHISSVQAVESPWYYGWGIRFIPNGTLYNTSGSKSLELKFYDTNKIIRIGTQHPNKFANELKKAIASLKEFNPNA